MSAVRDLVGRRGDPLGDGGVEQAEVGVHAAAAALIRPSQWTTGAGIGSPETGKFSTAFRVSPPHSSVFPVTSVTALAD